MSSRPSLTVARLFRGPVPRLSLVITAGLALVSPTAADTPFAIAAVHLGAEQADVWGHALAMLGDVDADGVDDYAVGSIHADTVVSGIPLSDTGRVDVYSGATHAVLHSWSGQIGIGDEFGFAVAPAGDVDGDGHHDVLVGSPGASFGGAPRGRVDVRSGATGSLLRVDPGFHDFGRFGHALALGDDYDGDGVRDYAVSSPHEWTSQGTGAETAPGVVRVVSGATGAWLAVLDGAPLLPVSPLAPDLFFDRENWGETLAFSGGRLVVASTGADLVDAPHGPVSAMVVRANCGLVACYEGGTFHQLWARAGSAQNEQYGQSLAAPGGDDDLDGDGVGDVLASSWQHKNASGQHRGLVEGLSGIDGAVLFALEGEAGQQIGYGLAGLGDVDDDGVPDLAIAAHKATVDGASDAGVLRVRSGADLAVLFTTTGPPESLFGMTLAGGDLDGDGRGELLCGAPYDDTVALSAGRATLYSPGCVASWSTIGPGVAGTGGVVPRLMPQGPPTLGATMVLLITNTSGVPTTCWLVFGLAQVALPFKGGTLYTDPLLTLPVPMPTSSALLPLPLPEDETLCDITIAGQFLVPDPGASAGFALSPGVALHLGH